MKVLVIGMGHAGRRHARLLMELGHTVICYDVKGCDTFEAGLETKLVCVASSLESAFKTKPDAAIIATPPMQHCEPTLACLNMGIPRILVEKPLAPDVAEAVMMCKSAERHNAVLSVGYMLRAHPTITLLRHQLKQGLVFGPVYAAYFECCWQPQATTYPWAGVVAETSHELDLASYLFGEYRGDVHCWGYDHKFLRALGVFGDTHCSFHLDICTARYRRTVTIYGEREVQQYDLNSSEVFTAAYRDQLLAWLDDQPLCSGREALETVKLIEALT